MSECPVLYTTSLIHEILQDSNGGRNRRNSLHPNALKRASKQGSQNQFAGVTCAEYE